MSTITTTEERTGQIRLPGHTMPSDYSDVQPSSYDPDYIKHISSRMQVPDRIAVGGGTYGGNLENSGNNMTGGQFTGMMVPDKIVVAGEERHLGMRSDLNLDLNNKPPENDGMAYVSLITPPRTLTLEETFPSVEEEQHKSPSKTSVSTSVTRVTSNGHVAAPVAYDPGVNMDDSLLLNEEDEAKLLRTQVAKLTRRVQVVEQDNMRRSQRELALYPLVFGYFIWRVLGWLIRDR